MDVAVLVFNNFETLDVFGPVEILGRLSDEYHIRFYSQLGGTITNQHGVVLLTDKLEAIDKATGLLLIPGGYGTRIEVDNQLLIARIRQMALDCSFVMTVCTGAALLARTGLLDGLHATTNKKAFDWVMDQGRAVKWNRKARWCKDGKFYTSAGVSAGMDMTLGFLQDRHGIEFARKTAFAIEYDWKESKDDDLFFLQ